MQFHSEDRGVFDDDTVKLTKDGYLIATPRVARTGIQLYSGKEMGQPDKHVVRVYRPEAEVFSKDALASYAFRPVTDNHPPEMVSANNWKKYAVGSISGDVLRDGEFIRTPLVVMDRATIRKIADGKAELSVGYDTEIVFGEGLTPDGQPYDAVQTAIRVNHVAIVDAARGGNKLRIGDEVGHFDNVYSKQPAEPKVEIEQMSTKIVDVAGIKLEVPEVAASVIAKVLADGEANVKRLMDALDAANAALADATSKSVTALSEAVAAHEATKAALVEANKKLADGAMTPALLDAAVAARADVIAKAKAVMGATFDAGTKSDAAIRREVVDAKIGDAAKGWSDDNVSAAFVTLTRDAKSVVDNSTVHRQAAAFDGVNTGDAFAIADKAVETRNARLANAWKTAGAAN